METFEDDVNNECIFNRDKKLVFQLKETNTLAYYNIVFVVINYDCKNLNI
jgi:hypothetical protein